VLPPHHACASSIQTLDPALQTTIVMPRTRAHDSTKHTWFSFASRWHSRTTANKSVIAQRLAASLCMLLLHCLLLLLHRRLRRACAEILGALAFTQKATHHSHHVLSAVSIALQYTVCLAHNLAREWRRDQEHVLARTKNTLLRRQKLVACANTGACHASESKTVRHSTRMAAAEGTVYVHSKTGTCRASSRMSKFTNEWPEK
jgi:hypothetical protein